MAKKLKGKSMKADLGKLEKLASDRPIGRPTACTSGVASIIAKAVEMGTPISVACQVAGIAVTTFCNWKNRAENEIARIDDGEDPDPGEAPFVEFLHQLKRAEGRSHQLAVERINAIAKDIESTDARVRLEADKFLLERRFKDDWGRNERIHQTVDGGVELRLNLPEPSSGRAIDDGELIDMEYLNNHPMAQVGADDDDDDDLIDRNDDADDGSEVDDDDF